MDVVASDAENCVTLGSIKIVGCQEWHLIHKGGFLTHSQITNLEKNVITVINCPTLRTESNGG